MQLVANARYGIYDLSNWQDKTGQWRLPRNVFIELGMAIALNRPTLLLRHTSNKSLPLPTCLQGVELLDFAGETTLKRALAERLPQWLNASPDRDWLNRFCIFGSRICNFREEHPCSRQWGNQTLCCHAADGLDKNHSTFQIVERTEIRGAFEDAFGRYTDLTVNYLDELPLTNGYQYLLCSYCQEVRSTPFAVYHILPHTPAEVFIAIGMSIALETLFEYDIPKILLVRQEQDLPSLLRGYEVVEAINSHEIKRKLQAFIPTVMQKVRKTAWKPKPLPFIEISTFSDIGNVNQLHDDVVDESVDTELDEIYEGTPIEELELSTRVYNLLKGAGINEVQELLKRELEGLLFIRNFGQQSLRELIRQLEIKFDRLTPTEQLLLTNRNWQAQLRTDQTRDRSLALDQLMQKALERGYLITNDLLTAFPDAEGNMAQLEEVFVQLINQGIEVYSDIEEAEEELTSKWQPEEKLLMTIFGKRLSRPLSAERQIELKEVMKSILRASLIPREIEVISLRFGFRSNRTYNVKEIGKTLFLTQKSVYFTEIQALRKLRHPTQSELLRKYLTDEDQSIAGKIQTSNSISDVDLAITGLIAQVVNLFEATGAKVEQEYRFPDGGVDLRVEWTPKNNQTQQLAVQVKETEKLVGVDTVRAFSAATKPLQEAGVVEELIFVSKSGFTQAAQTEANNLGVSLFDLDTLSFAISNREVFGYNHSSQQPDINSTPPQAWKDTPVGLPKIQRDILEFVKTFILDNGYSPTIKEIRQAVGIRATSVVNYNLDTLQQAGYLYRDRTVSRGIRLVDERINSPNTIKIPLLGRIAASEPIRILEGSFDVSSTIEISSELANDENVYALIVADNLVGGTIEINKGDIVVLQQTEVARNGELVAIWFIKEEQSILRRFYWEEGRIRLQAENAAVAPIYADSTEIKIQGRVIAVIRREVPDLEDEI